MQIPRELNPWPH